MSAGVVGIRSGGQAASGPRVARGPRVKSSGSRIVREKGQLSFVRAIESDVFDVRFRWTPLHRKRQFVVRVLRRVNAVGELWMSANEFNVIAMPHVPAWLRSNLSGTV